TKVSATADPFVICEFTSTWHGLTVPIFMSKERSGLRMNPDEVISIFMSKERSGLRMNSDEVVSIFMSKERSGLRMFYGATAFVIFNHNILYFFKFFSFFYKVNAFLRRYS
ncbi:MAG: hypothetical protein IJW37_01085, partial [Lachnospiraceae bacterium]|nr:hypothetical protein [Lachnospiraceae bacterium]